ncbi:CsoR family transcriptional regulator [Kosmotoga arenicorallina S304]|uniref:Copper-sensing transcriptional repressor CsoR n=1 Tax=Kosmotoga arenicorallina S304 TaxID=1453497 RepID=A0A176JYN3_9BACT|nr:metal-sensing transcriptional repressor [Kosmotoga arenicorallina]OAA29001.1 CsoR family transcriptional regulator [Kosmotoga arenicorallina S304]
MKDHSHHVKHQGTLRILKTAKGQIEGIMKMIEDERYCVDISTQLLAVIALLKKANTEIINRHIETCVRDAIETGLVDDKIKELEQLMKHIEKNL